MLPRYIESYENGALKAAAQTVESLLSSCAICPRSCRVDREHGQLGFCRTGKMAMVYSYMSHHGEEPPISGTKGSGTIFFSNCNLGCVYCQNYEFSRQGRGQEVNSGELAGIMLELQGLGVHNINLVTPTHVMPAILAALVIAVPKGLKIPLVYNTSGYELPEIIRSLNGIVDIYLADMRYGNSESAAKYSSAPDYPQFNQAAVKVMHRQVGVAKFDDQGIMQRGLIVRHLVLPHEESGTGSIMRFIRDEISEETYISLMSQYLPYYRAREFPQINRRLSKQEYVQAQEIMANLGLHNGWMQDAYGLERFAGVNIKPYVSGT